MKKTLASLFLVLSTFNFFGQTIIKGRVISNNNTPIEGASVYLNNTTIGVSSNENGAFELLVKAGTHTLIVSFIGYTTIQYQLVTSDYKKFVVFKLTRNTNMLNEVVIKKTVYDKYWRNNLLVFKRSFLGKTQIAQSCIILNPKVLSFDFNLKIGLLTANASEPLIIKNKGLGYLVTYDLVDFSLGRKRLSYLGYTKYQNLTGSKRKLRRWKKNRLKAFHGSRMHFMRSLRTRSLKNEGFLVNQFKRVPNLERPSEEDIRNAQNLIRLNGGFIDHRRTMTTPITPLEAAYITIKKIKLPKHKDSLYKKGVPYTDIISVKNSNISISFKDYLSIIYTREKEENNYARRKKWNNSPLNYQTSAITMTTKTAILDPSGDIIDPLSIFAEGYWSFEQFADMLPLNYQPIKD